MPLHPRRRPPATGRAAVVAFRAARTAKMQAEAERAELELRVRRGALVDRKVGERIVLTFGRLLRDAWLAWPARIGPELAAEFAVNAGALTVALEDAVRAHLSSGVSGDVPLAVECR